MQFAKDSFYMALRDRLAEVNPSRTVTVNGMARPAVVVVENESSPAAMENAFVLSWGEAGMVGSGTKLMKLTCAVNYRTQGLDKSNGDRGRVLGTLDGELMAISQPPRVPKTNYAIIPPQTMGTMMFWTEFEFSRVKDEAGCASRSAKTTVYFYSEVEQ